MQKALRLFRLAVWGSFQHDIFTIARAAAYYSILTLFPALMIVATVLASFDRTRIYLIEIAKTLHQVMPPGTARGQRRAGRRRMTTHPDLGVRDHRDLRVGHHRELDGRLLQSLPAALHLERGEAADDRYHPGASDLGADDCRHHLGGLRI